MKLLVFAPQPPPHHGQSYMVKLMLDASEATAEAKFSGPFDIGLLPRQHALL